MTVIHTIHLVVIECLGKVEQSGEWSVNSQIDQTFRMGLDDCAFVGISMRTTRKVPERGQRNSTSHLLHLNSKQAVESATSRLNERDRVFPGEIGKGEQMTRIDVDGDDERILCERERLFL